MHSYKLSLFLAVSLASLNLAAPVDTAIGTRGLNQAIAERSHHLAVPECNSRFADCAADPAHSGNFDVADEEDPELAKRGRIKGWKGATPVKGERDAPLKGRSEALDSLELSKRGRTKGWKGSAPVRGDAKLVSRSEDTEILLKRSLPDNGWLPLLKRDEDDRLESRDVEHAWLRRAQHPARSDMGIWVGA